jgi:Domain of unknown function (DUF4062)
MVKPGPFGIKYFDFRTDLVFASMAAQGARLACRIIVVRAPVAKGGGTCIMIRTPDQRVRVFVSSTLEELAAERQAVTAAITQLRLTPVLFELGARPYPPRDLYRAYLEQSDVFIGIYAASYGWVAPGMEVSGLEDEYRLSAGKPRLIYTKKASRREPRLTSLLKMIQAEGVVSYRHFEDAGAAPASCSAQAGRCSRRPTAWSASSCLMTCPPGGPPPVRAATRRNSIAAWPTDRAGISTARSPRVWPTPSAR